MFCSSASLVVKAWEFNRTFSKKAYRRVATRFVQECENLIVIIFFLKKKEKYFIFVGSSSKRAHHVCVFVQMHRGVIKLSLYTNLERTLWKNCSIYLSKYTHHEVNCISVYFILSHISDVNNNLNLRDLFFKNIQLIGTLICTLSLHNFISLSLLALSSFIIIINIILTPYGCQILTNERFFTNINVFQ